MNIYIIKNYIIYFKISLNVLKHYILINEKFNLINPKKFHNNEINKYLNYRKEFKTFYLILEKKYDNKKPFCLISYIFLFCISSKNEIIKRFNDKKQTDEIINFIELLSIFYGIK